MPKSRDFNKLKESLIGEYLGKPVPKKYQKRYGKRYGKKDIDELSYAIANTRGIKID